MGGVPAWNGWVESSAVGRRRGVGACDSGIGEDRNALGVVREDKVNAYLVVVEVVVWQLDGLTCVVDCGCWLKRSLSERVGRAEVRARALRSWVVAAHRAATRASTVSGAILT